MDLKKYLARPFVETDYGPLSRLRSITSPELPSTPEQERHWDQSMAAPHLLNEKWAVEERGTGTVVAIGAMAHSAFTYDPAAFWVSVLVDPAHSRQGIGRALGALLESEAVSHHATCLWTTARKDDPRGLEFARKQGFVELRTSWMSTLDLSEVGVPPPSARGAALEAEGIRITTLAQEGPNRPDVRKQLFELLMEASRDVPRMGEYTPISFDQFVSDLEGPGMLADAFFLARYGEAYIGLTNLERNLAREDYLEVGFTATRAAYRGRGIASELKRKAIEYAHRKGVRYLRTFNDSLNRPIWAINEKLGFRRQVEWSQQERRLSPGTAGIPPTPGR